jgi:hypothetical protein
VHLAHPRDVVGQAVGRRPEPTQRLADAAELRPQVVLGVPPFWVSTEGN